MFPSELPFPRLDPRTPDAVRTILLMANKYQVDFVRRIIVTRLESDWPQTIEAWQRLEHEIEGMREDARGGVWNGTRGPSLELDNALPEPASAIRLARECNIPSILPPAFYHLSRLSIEDDWDLVRSYGPKKLTDVRKPQLSYGFRSARWSLLRAEDFRCLLIGKLAIEKHRACHSGLLPCRRSDGDDATDDWEECALEDEPENLKNFNNRIRDASTSDTDLLKVLGREQKYFMESWLFCWECREQIENRLNIWKKLPEYFALP